MQKWIMLAVINYYCILAHS